MFYLNTTAPLEAFQEAVNGRFFVDKSMLIKVVSERFGIPEHYLCITKPRRFGKSMNANMLAAFYSKAVDARNLFGNSNFAKAADCKQVYTTHINQHNVIFIDLSKIPDECGSYSDYIKSIRRKLRRDLVTAYPSLTDWEYDSIRDMLQATGDKFVFILDEWDSIFYKEFMTAKDKNDYLRFLESLLKGQSYVELAYMTGVLPIEKYSSGSAINMFNEYSFISDPIFDSYFGFTEDEVRALCQRYDQLSYEEIEYWYDGYHTKDGKRLFNPRSVNNALYDGICRNYWTETEPMNEIADCIEHNIDAVREDIVQLTAEIPVKIKLQGYSASDQRLTDRNEILSAMVVYGFLSYYNQTLSIPNHELMEKYNQVLARKSMGKVAAMVARSREVLEATWRGDSDTVSEIIEQVHDTEIPLFKYSDENSLSCVVTLAYLYARDFYRVEREEKSGKGYCDYLFTPLDKSDPAIILELKYGKSAEEALEQIKQRNYIQKVQDYPEVLLVGINYARNENKHHQCVIERVKNII